MTHPSGVYVHPAASRFLSPAKIDEVCRQFTAIRDDLSAQVDACDRSKCRDHGGHESWAVHKIQTAAELAASYLIRLSYGSAS